MVTVDKYFDKIYYINLEKDVERNQNMLDQFEKFGIKNYKRIEAVKVETIPKDQSLYRNFIKGGDKYVLGSLGCRASHLKAIKDAKENGYKKILIFEDDVIMLNNPSFFLQNSINLEWDMLYFGGLVEQEFRNQIVQAHSYAISWKVFNDIIYMAESSGMEINNFYAKILQHMSYNYNPGGRYRVRITLPFNGIIQDKSFESNIVASSV